MMEGQLDPMQEGLRKAVDDARAANMPAENVKRAIQKGTGELPGANYEELTFEGYAPGGVAVANVISALEGPQSRLLFAAYKTMQAAFAPEGHVYAFPRYRRGSEAENVILVATAGGEVLDSGELLKRHARLATDWLKQSGLDSVVAGVMVRPPDLTDAPLLTDDFCPTDSMVYR